MASNESAISNVGDTFQVLVEYGGQRKSIDVAQSDNLSSIEGKIYTRFEFNNEQIKNLQIQWYDNDLKEFIDLDKETWLKYTTNQQCRENQINNESPKYLQLVQKQLVQQHNNVEVHQIAGNNEQDGNQSLPGSSHSAVHHQASHGTNGTGGKISKCHSYPLIIARWLLPILAVLAHIGDAVWSIEAYNPENKIQKNYAGLISTILILFYYLHYDVRFERKYRNCYLIYQSFILVGIVTGDLVYVCYYRYYKRDTVLMGFFIAYMFIDILFVVAVGYFKYKEYDTTMNVSTENLFHLLSELEIILIIYIPIFTAYEAMTTNCIAFFIIYRCFSHSYKQQTSCYPRISCGSFWFLIIFATASVICENYDFVFDGYAHDAHQKQDQKKEEHYEKIAVQWRYASNGAEILAAISCYILIVLQFPKDDKKKKGANNYEMFP